MKKILFCLVNLYIVVVCAAQPAVRNEPRHHNVFENEYVRVLDVYLPPNDTTQFHVHATPSVFITFTKTATASEILGQQPVSSVSNAGGIWYDSLVTPRIHRVWNEDTTWFHVMDIELIAGKPGAIEPALHNAAARLLFDKPLANVYQLSLNAQESLKLPAAKTGYLLISPGDASVTVQTGNSFQHRVMKAGHYCWIEPGRELSVTNNKEPATFFILQLK